MNTRLILIVNEERYFTLPLVRTFESKYPGVLKEVIFVPEFGPDTPLMVRMKLTLINMHIMGIRFVTKYLWHSFTSRLKNRTNQDHVGILFSRFKNINTPEFVTYLNEQRDIVIINICSQIYSVSTLTLLRHRIYNIHPSLLPANKGKFPLFWAVATGNPIGITAHLITRQIDAGTLLHQMYLGYETQTTMSEILEKVLSFYPQFIAETFDCIEKERGGYIYEPGLRSGYQKPPRHGQIRKFKKTLRLQK